MKSIQVLLVDDEPNVLRGLRMRLALEADIAVVGEATDGATAVALADRLDPDVVLMDVNMPSMDGIAATRELASRAPRAAVVILTMHDDRVTRDSALAAGAVAFVAKHQMDDALVSAIRSAAGNRKGASD